MEQAIMISRGSGENDRWVCCVWLCQYGDQRLLPLLYFDQRRLVYFQDSAQHASLLPVLFSLPRIVLHLARVAMTQSEEFGQSEEQGAQLFGVYPHFGVSDDGIYQSVFTTRDASIADITSLNTSGFSFARGFMHRRVSIVAMILIGTYVESFG